jgi:dipeptidyl aminopeptidase/acylaminoacyl peptidase
VYEYGGSAYDALPDGRLMFSNKDGAVYLLEPTTGEVTKVTGTPTLRYSNFSANPKDPWVLAVEEDHEHDTPAQVKNYVVAINTITYNVVRVVSGSDFYYTPQFSPDGNSLAWLEWDHPNLPFSSAKLFSAIWNSDGYATSQRLICGSNNEGVAEPRWGPDGSLFYGREIDGYRQLFRIRPNTASPEHIKLEFLSDAEFGQISWFQGR